MAFRLKPQESIPDGLRRLAKKQLMSARDELGKSAPPGDDAIHEARKSIKKVRAVMDLIEADDGHGLAGCRKPIRKVNRTLSRLRDADAMLAILTKLRDAHPKEFDEHSLARVRRHLSSHKQASLDAAQADGVWTKVDAQLRKLRNRTKRWRPTHRGFRALAAGIRVTYRRGRKALARAREKQRAADFHEWRKEIKALWYQLRLLERCTPGIAKDIRALHEAETWLGDDHNVVVLCAELSKEPSLCDLTRLHRAANRDQSDLRRKAIASAAPLYRHGAGAYVRRIERAWSHWRQNVVTQTRATRVEGATFIRSRLASLPRTHRKSRFRRPSRSAPPA